MPARPPAPDQNPDLNIPEVNTIAPSPTTSTELDDDETRARMGRPPMDLTETLRKQLLALGALHATFKEIAQYTGVSIDTLRRRPDFRAVIEKGREQGKVSLRRAQFRSAINQGNIVMQIWLGKQLLGQSEKDILAELGQPEDLHHNGRAASDMAQLRSKITRIQQNLEQAEASGNLPKGVTAGVAPEDVHLVEDDSGVVGGQRLLPPPQEEGATKTFEFEQRIRHRKGPHFIAPVPNLVPDAKTQNPAERILHKRVRR